MLHSTAFGSAKPDATPSSHLVAWRRRLAVAACATRPRRCAAVAASKQQHASCPAVRPIGPEPQSLMPTMGMVPNQARMSQVGEQWQPLLSSITAAYKTVCGKGLVGVYLRGSLPRGLFIEGVSDVDTFALVLEAGNAAEEANDAAAALRQHIQALAAQHAHLGFTKIEAHVAGIPAASPTGVLLAQAREHTPAPQLPLSLLQHVPLAFELKAQSVCIWGLDLPVALPDVAALPSVTPQLLPSLVEDVAAAVQSVEKHADDAAMQVRAVRWALKRCIRSAFELVAAEAGTFTRDLYWCASIAGQRLPHMQPQLNVALELYVQLLELVQHRQQQQHQGAAFAAAPVEAACLLASSLSSALDDAFCEQMLVEDPGWLTKHVAQLPQVPNAKQEAGGHHVRGWLGQLLQPNRRPSQPPVLNESLVAGCHPPPVCVPISGSVQELQWANDSNRSIAAATIAACINPTQHNHFMESANNNQQHKLQQIHQQGDQQVHLYHHQQVQHHHQQQQQQQQQVQPLPFYVPLLLRGLAADWAQCLNWDLEWLHGQSFAGKARVAPSLQFPFCEPMLLAYLTATAGAAAAPSFEMDMPSSEFAERLCGVGGHVPLAHGSHEHYYLQAKLPEELAAAVELQPLLDAIAAVGVAASGMRASGADGSSDCSSVSTNGSSVGSGSSDGSRSGSNTAAGSATKQRPNASQQPRLWVSAWGSVSPLHMDVSHSFLVQLHGIKRMLFFAPEQTPFLYPYQDTHLLRRRSRVNLCVPDAAKHPLFERACAMEALLLPGDAVWFPSGWWHYTESLGSTDGQPGGVSVSVTCRLAGNIRPNCE